MEKDFIKKIKIQIDYTDENIIEMLKEKEKDSSQEEIQKGNHIIYPLKLKTGEIVNNKNEFIRSNHWQSVKKIYIKFYKKINNEKRDNKYTCECCGKKSLSTDTQLHHLTYKNIGNENFKELMYLCFKCHMKVHGKAEISKKEYKSNKDVKKGNLLNLDSLILLGKYKEDKLTLKKIIEKDKEYVEWLIKKEIIRINDKALAYLLSKTGIAEIQRFDSDGSFGGVE